MPSIQSFYDRLGPRYDWFSFYEAQAKALALERLEGSAGQRILNVGVGTGKEHREVQKTTGEQGLAVGLDISPVMAATAKKRSGAPVVQADARFLPFAEACFDRLLCTYVLDLIPGEDLLAVLHGFRRVLRPGGQAVLVSLTEGVSAASRAFVGVWKAAYQVSPFACGGCRPLELSALVEEAGFMCKTREVIVQIGVPSEILTILRPNG